MKKTIEQLLIVILLIAILAAGCAPAVTPTPRPYKIPTQITPELQKQTLELMDRIVGKQTELNAILQSNVSIDEKIIDVQYFANSLDLLLHDYPAADENLRMYTLNTKNLFMDYANYLEANKNKDQEKFGYFVAMVLGSLADGYAKSQGQQPQGIDQQVAADQAKAEADAAKQEANMTRKLSEWYSESNRLYAYLAQTYNFVPVDQPLTITEIITNTPIIITNTPPPPITDTPEPPAPPANNTGGQSNCSLNIGRKVTVMSDTRYWSQPDVNGATFTDVPSGSQYYILSGPTYGTIHYASGSKGWWWEVSKKSGGKSLGWIWEGKFVECQ